MTEDCVEPFLARCRPSISGLHLSQCLVSLSKHASHHRSWHSRHRTRGPTSSWFPQQPLHRSVDGAGNGALHSIKANRTLWGIAILANPSADRKAPLAAGGRIINRISSGRSVPVIRGGHGRGRRHSCIRSSLRAIRWVLGEARRRVIGCGAPRASWLAAQAPTAMRAPVIYPRTAVRAKDPAAS